KSALLAFVNANCQGHLLSVAAIAASLTRVPGIHSFKRPAGAFSLAFRYREKLPPGHVKNGLCKMAVLHHPANGRSRPHPGHVHSMERTENVILPTRVGERHRREDLPWTSVPCPPTSSECRAVPRPPHDAQGHCREHALCRTRGPR